MKIAILHGPCLYRKLDSAVMVMKSAEDEHRCDAAYVLPSREFPQNSENFFGLALPRWRSPNIPLEILTLPHQLCAPCALCRIDEVIE
jgi:hypothetical protein